MPTVHIYLDLISPYAWFAWTRIRAAVAPHPVQAHPVLFAGLLGHWGHKGPAEIPPKRVFTFKDVTRIAAREGLTLRGPATHPFNPLTALRVCLPEVSGAHQHAALDALFTAGWSHGCDLGSPTEIAAALTAAGLPGDVWVSQTRDPSVKRALIASTEQAVERGVFGVPTMCVGEELVFGNDRIDDVVDILAGRDPVDPDALARLLAKPRGSARRPT